MSAGGRRQAAAGRRLAAGGWRLPAVGTPRAAGGRGGPAGPVARSGQGAEHRQIAAAPPVAISAAGGRPAGRSARIAPENPTPCGAGAAIPRAAPTPGKSASVPDRERARASAAVRRTASAGTFPARSPETGARRLTAEQERCLAADICATAWAESRGTRYPFSHRFLGILARADLSRADELAEDLPPGPARDAITAELLRTDPDAGLARVHLNGVAPHLAARAARSLAARNPAAARVLLDRVIAAAQQAPPGSSFAAKTYAAALAKDLGDGRAADLVEEALQHPPPAPPLAGPWSIPRASRVAMSLSSLAQVDREAALRVVEQMLPPPERQYARESLATYVARGDPEGALQVLGEAPGQTDSFVEKQCWSLAALKVVVPLARRAAAKAEDLARRVPMPNHRSEALALAARALPAPAAAAARQEALDAAAQAGSVEAPARILTVAELMPPGPERVRLCAQALDLGSQRPEGVPLPLTIRAAFLLAPSAPETARAMLEDVLAVCPECEGPAGPWDLFPHPWGSTAPKDLRSSLAAAFAAVDPARAVEVARTIPADRPEQRFNALCKIAEYLLLPPDERLIVSSRYLLWGQSPRVREEE